MRSLMGALILATGLAVPATAQAPVPSPWVGSHLTPVRREMVKWFNGVEIPRKTEVEQIMKETAALDAKAANGTMQPADIIDCYQNHILPRYEHILDLANRFHAQSSEVSELNRYLTYYTRMRIDRLKVCIADLARDDKKAFRKDQLHYLSVDDTPFVDLKASTSKRFAR
jgi:hypothetical protein